MEDQTSPQQIQPMDYFPLYGLFRYDRRNGIGFSGVTDDNGPEESSNHNKLFIYNYLLVGLGILVTSAIFLEKSGGLEKFLG